MSEKTAVLLVNLGSPAAPTRTAVRRYLKEFLWDPRVVNIPRAIWWIILHFLVLPFRPGKSAKAYRKIWNEQGSPLIYLTQQLVDKIVHQFNPDEVQVEMAMRYGKPAISDKLSLFKQRSIEKLIVIPLYPQYSSTTTASVYDSVVKEISSWRHIPDFDFISDYHRNSDYIHSVAASIRKDWKGRDPGQILLISFHGLPVKLSELGDPYYQQCQKTAILIAEKLELENHQWMIVFQSRFGKAEWLQPYCVQTLAELPTKGLTNIDIICPGFAVDCLETLEEIALTNRSIFISAGGTDYHYIPALNSTGNHIDTLVNLIKTHL